MSYFVSQGFDSRFHMDAKNIKPAYEALLAYTTKFDPKILAAGKSESGRLWYETLDDLLAIYGWDAETDDEGNIVSLFLNCESLYRMSNFELEAIAPFVEKGSKLIFEGEDGTWWCWYFDGQKCTYYPGKVVFPGMPDDEEEE